MFYDKIFTVWTGLNSVKTCNEKPRNESIHVDYALTDDKDMLFCFCIKPAHNLFMEPSILLNKGEFQIVVVFCFILLLFCYLVC